MTKKPMSNAQKNNKSKNPSNKSLLPGQRTPKEIEFLKKKHWRTLDDLKFFKSLGYTSQEAFLEIKFNRLYAEYMRGKKPFSSLDAFKEKKLEIIHPVNLYKRLKKEQVLQKTSSMKNIILRIHQSGLIDSLYNKLNKVPKKQRKNLFYDFFLEEIQNLYVKEEIKEIQNLYVKEEIKEIQNLYVKEEIKERKEKLVKIKERKEMYKYAFASAVKEKKFVLSLFGD